MQTMRWVETKGGWRAGRYRVELAAPGMWALVLAGPDASGVSGARLLTTAASLRAAQRAAARHQARRRRTYRLWLNSALTGAVLTGLILLPQLPPAGVVIISVAALLLGFRYVAVVTDTLTSTSWARLRHIYQ